MFRSESLRRAVASLECMGPGCGAPAPTQAAHRNEGKGRSLKQSDALLAALCPECHRMLEQGVGLTRDERRQLWNESAIRTYQALIERGLLEVTHASVQAV